jgi:hypothetical protein
MIALRQIPREHFFIEQKDPILNSLMAGGYDCLPGQGYLGKPPEDK